MREGRLGYRIEAKRSDEIGEAQRGFNDMARCLEESEKAQHDAIQDITDAGHGDDGNNHCQPKRITEKLLIGESQRDERAKHHHVALSEIDLLGCLVNQDKPKCDQTVNTAIRQTADQ